MNQVRRVFLPALLFFTLFCICIAQTTPPPQTNPDYSKEGAIVDQYVTHATFENNGTGVRVTDVKVHVQSGAGVQKFGLLEFAYQSFAENLEVVYVHVRKTDGSIVSTPAENIQDAALPVTREAPMYSDLREKHVAVKGLSPGDELEYECRWTINKPLVPGQFWLDYNFNDELIVLDEQLEVRVPKQRTIKFKSPNFTPVITEDGTYRVFTWKTRNIQNKVESDDDKVEKLVHQMQGRLPQPDLRLSSFQSWEQVGHWYAELQKDRITPTPEIQAKAAELTKSASDESAKIRAIYNYVSTEFRYIGIDFGIGRYQPHAAEEVLDNQYGDCKDKHTLLAALLGAVKIKIYPALINVTHDVDADIPSPSQFNHVISVMPQGRDLVWLDTTPEVAPLGFLLSPLMGKQALVIGDDRPATLTPTPSERPSAGKMTFHIEAKLDDSGTLTGKVERQNAGDDRVVVLRQAFRKVSLAHWKDLMQQISYQSGFSGEVSDVSASSTEKIDAPLDYSYTYTRKDYPDWANRRISPPLPLILLPAPKDKAKKSSARIWLAKPQEDDLDASVELPKDYSPQPPASINLVYDFAEYHATYEAREGKLIAHRKLLIKMEEVPIDEEGSYETFQKAVIDDRDGYVPLVKASSLNFPSIQLSNALALRKYVQDLPDSTNTEALELERQTAGINNFNGMKDAIPTWERAVELDPKFARVWVKLATAYISVDRKPDGMNAFHKAIEADPKQAAVYKVFGLTLMSQRNFEEAVKVWRQLIVNVPSDADGPTNLGASLFQLKQYPEAVKVLETAKELSPDSLAVWFPLAIAYLHVGNTESGLKTFDQVLQKWPGPGMTNDVAYSMAEADVALPQALTYAQLAVQAEEEISRKLNLATLTDDDLKDMNTLGMFWDTLGWVNFRLKKYADAEKALRAAWMLAQHPAAGEHLGEVYEQLQKKEAARQMYQLALGAVSFNTYFDTKEIMDRMHNLGPLPPLHISRFGGPDDLSAVRTTRLPRLAQGQVSAEFFFLFAPGNKVEEVKFISGSEKLKSADKTLRITKFDVPFPNGSNARLVRRGILSCYPYSGCEVVFLTLDKVKSVN